MARPSPVRSAIVALVASTERHDWTIEDIAAALAERGVGADFSTVFRAVARLEADDELRRVALGDGRARYERPGGHHEHVRCERCGVVDAVPGCMVDAAIPHVRESTGFTVTGHELVFSGVCPACRVAVG